MRQVMLIVRLRGGLGNQLFSYAAAKRLAVANQCELVVDDVTGFIRDVRYGRSYALGAFAISARKATPSERLEPFERARRAVAKSLARLQPYHSRRYIEQESNDFDPRLLKRQLQGTTYIDGLWQSELYFEDIGDIVRSELKMREPSSEAALDLGRRIRSCNSVAVHVRCFEDPGLESPYNLSHEYYARAFEIAARELDHPDYFVFSDRPDRVRDRLEFPPNSTFVVSPHDPLGHADFWLMSQCRHYVIANSTFSWWAAWLGGESQKLVIAPAANLSGTTAWGFKGLIPERWTKV